MEVLHGVTESTADRIDEAVRAIERTRTRQRNVKRTRLPVAFPVKFGVTKAAIAKDASGTCYLASHPSGATTIEIDNCFNPCAELPATQRVMMIPVMADGLTVMTHYLRRCKTMDYEVGDDCTHIFSGETPATVRVTLDAGVLSSGDADEQDALDELESGMDCEQGVTPCAWSKVYTTTPTGTLTINVSSTSTYMRAQVNFTGSGTGFAFHMQTDALTAPYDGGATRRLDLGGVMTGLIYPAAGTELGTMEPV